MAMTAREKAMRLIKTNPKWREAPKSGAVTAIAGARPFGLVSLSDKQLSIVTDAAANLSPEKRVLLLERIAARLRLIGRFDDRDLEAAVQVAAHNQGKILPSGCKAEIRGSQESPVRL